MTVPDPRHRFPAAAPLIEVEPTDQQLDPIDCRELQWWLAVPCLGDRTACGSYDVDTGELRGARQVLSTEPVDVAGQAAVDMRLSEWSPDLYGGRIAVHRFTCVLDQDRARWLAVTLDTEGPSDTAAEGDPGFENAWGATGPRRLVDTGRYQQLPDGGYHLTGPSGRGAGVHRVRVGARTFTCLRVIDLDTPEPDESTEVGVAFVEPGGRTILYRQYRGRAMNQDWQEWRAAHPGREIVLDGNLFLQRDCTGHATEVLTTSSMRDYL